MNVLFFLIWFFIAYILKIVLLLYSYTKPLFYRKQVVFIYFFIDFVFFLYYIFHMARILYNTRLEKELIKEFKILAIKQEKRQNQLLEEAIKDLLKKYEKKVKK